MILKQFRQYTIDGVNYTSLADIQKSLNLTMMQISWRRKKDPGWLVVVKGPVGVKAPKKEYYILDGVKYLTMVEAARAHGITREAVRQRVKSSWWHWFKVVEGVQQPKVMQSIDKTSYYYRKKNGIKVPMHKPKKYKPRIKTMTPYNFNRINNLQKPKEIREILDDIFAKKEAKKHKK